MKAHQGFWVPEGASCQGLVDQSYQGCASLCLCHCSAPLSSYCQVPFHLQLLSLSHLADKNPEAEGSGFKWLCHITTRIGAGSLRGSVPSEVLVLEAAGGSGSLCFPLTGHLRTCKQSSFSEPEGRAEAGFPGPLPHSRQVLTSGLGSEGEFLHFLWARQGWRKWELGPSSAGGRGP